MTSFREYLEKTLDDYTAFNGNKAGQLWWSFAVEPARDSILSELKRRIPKERKDLGDKILRHEILGAEYGRGYNKALTDVIKALGLEDKNE